MDENDYLPDASKIRFVLTDCPGNYKEVNIDIQSLEVIIYDSLIELETYQGIYNLLEFVNGKDTILVTKDILSGMLSQVKVILGENNTVIVDSVVYDLKVPSSCESGLEFNSECDFANTTQFDIEVFAGETTFLDMLWLQSARARQVVIKKECSF